MRLTIRLPPAALVLLPAWLTAALLLAPQATAQIPGQLQGDLPTSGGFALVVWGGGSPEALVDNAMSRGCSATAEWIAVGGALLGYIHGAPALVNEAFLGEFPDSSIPPGTALVVVCATGGPGSAPPPSPPPQPPLPPPEAPVTIEQQFGSAAFDAINGARQANGLPPLNLDTRLRTAAEKYAQLLRDLGQLGHEFDGEPWDRAQREGYPSGIVGEVIASVATSAPLDVQPDTVVLMQTWLNSPPHRDIIMGKDFAFTDLGVGCAAGKDSGGLNQVLCVGMTGIP